MARRTRDLSVDGAYAGAAMALVALFVIVVFFPLERASWNLWGAALVGPALFLASLPAFARQARREKERRVFSFLVVALLVKMSFSAFRFYHAFYVVDKADSQAYDRIGGEMALRFLHGDFTTRLENLFDTNFIRLFTGAIYTPIRPSALAGFFIYAWLAFWGTYFFYRAFVLAVPDGNRTSYAKWLFFMPSILFWPSSIGKESLLIFGLGIAAFGAAKTLSGRFVPGIVISALGIGVAALVRAPIGVLFGLALIVAGILRRPARGVRHTSPLARAGSFVVFVAIGLVLFVAMQRYLVRSGFGGEDLDMVISESNRLTSTGGSEFTPVPIDSPSGLVIGTGTILFRPFIFEAHTVEAVVTSLEASILLLFSVVRFRSIVAAIRNIRRSAYVLVAIIYVGGGIVALSPVANFGIIARQRVLIYPMYLVLLCFLPRKPRPERRGGVRHMQQQRTPSLAGSRT